MANSKSYGKTNGSSGSRPRYVCSSDCVQSKRNPNGCMFRSMEPVSVLKSLTKMKTRLKSDVRLRWDFNIKLNQPSKTNKTCPYQLERFDNETEFSRIMGISFLRIPRFAEIHEFALMVPEHTETRKRWIHSWDRQGRGKRRSNHNHRC
jgi:hypothetical protein